MNPHVERVNGKVYRTVDLNPRTLPYTFRLLNTRRMRAIAAMQNEYGVRIDVIAKDGESYTDRRHGGEAVHKRVPPGSVYVRISGKAFSQNLNGHP